MQDRTDRVQSGLFRASCSRQPSSAAVTGSDEAILKRSYVHCAERPFHLLLEYLFNLAYFLLDFAGEFFFLAFGFNGGIARDLSRPVLQRPLSVHETCLYLFTA